MSFWGRVRKTLEKLKLLQYPLNIWYWKKSHEPSDTALLLTPARWATWGVVLQPDSAQKGQQGELAQSFQWDLGQQEHRERKSNQTKNQPTSPTPQKTQGKLPFQTSSSDFSGNPVLTCPYFRWSFLGLASNFCYWVGPHIHQHQSMFKYRLNTSKNTYFFPRELQKSYTQWHNHSKHRVSFMRKKNLSGKNCLSVDQTVHLNPEQ